MATYRQSQSPKYFFVHAAVILAIFLMVPSIASAEGAASVSADAGRPNAVFIEVPNDPCAALLNNMPPFYQNLTLQFGPVDLDTRKLFLLKCNEKKDELIATITGPIEELKRQARESVQTAIDQTRNDLVGGFWKYVSEKLLEQLPASERAKYAPGSPESLALAHRWLNESPREEFETYVAAYFTQGGEATLIYEAYKAFMDFTNGESRTIIEAFKGVLDRARTRLGQVLNANRQIEAAPADTPTGDILENVGLSGRWVDNFKSYEGQIRDFDKNWKVGEALTIIQGAFETEVPHEKVRAFFSLMGTMSSLASDSKIPLVSIVGDIVGSYAQIANQTLDAVLALGNVIKKRHGYCLGLGVATDDERTNYFADQSILACPLAFGTWPFQHIYEAQEKDSGKLFFWNGDSFVAAENGSGRAGVLAALRLINGAEELGYAVTKDPKSHVALLAEVYNTAHPGGVPGLFEEAERIVTSIQETMDRFAGFSSLDGACSQQQILDTLQSRTGVSLTNIRKELSEKGSDRLVMTVAASFVAFEGRLGSAASARSNAFQTYFEAEEELAETSMIVLEGKVMDQNRDPVSGAFLGIKIPSGEEVRGCEAWQANRDGSFTVHAIGESTGLAIVATAETGEAKSREETFDLDYFRRVGRSFETVGEAFFGRAPGEIIIEIEPEEEQQASDSDPDKEPSAGEDENGEEETQTSTEEDFAELCKAQEARLAQANELVSSGNIAEARLILADLKDSPCETIAQRVTEVENAVAEGLDTLIASARAAANQCEPDAINAAAQSINTVQYPEAKAVQVELSSLATSVAVAIAVFDTARNAYLAGNLETAKSGLGQARQLFEQFNGTPDCSSYLTRITNGFDRIATLERALGLANAAIAGCDAGRIVAYQTRFNELAEKHVLIAAKASELNAVAENLALVRQLIGGAESDQDNNRIAAAGEKIARAQTVLNGALAGSNCSDLTARLDAVRSRQREAEGNVQGNCEILADLQLRAASDIEAGQLKAALKSLNAAQPLVGEPARIKACEALASEVVALIQTVAGMIGTLERTNSAIEACDIGQFDNLQAALAGYANIRIGEAVTRLEAARESCTEESEGTEEAETEVSQLPVPEEDALDLGGNWLGDGQLPLSLAGERVVLNFQIEIAVVEGASNGTVVFFNEGEAVGTFPISGRAQGRRVFHEDRWVYEDLVIPNSFSGRLEGENDMTGEGYLTLPELECLMKGIGEAIGGAMAGALGAFSDDDDSDSEAPCPFKRYSLNWQAQRQ